MAISSQTDHAIPTNTAITPNFQIDTPPVAVALDLLGVLQCEILCFVALTASAPLAIQFEKLMLKAVLLCAVMSEM